MPSSVHVLAHLLDRGACHGGLSFPKTHVSRWPRESSRSQPLSSSGPAGALWCPCRGSVPLPICRYLKCHPLDTSGSSCHCQASLQSLCWSLTTGHAPKGLVCTEETDPTSVPEPLCGDRAQALAAKPAPEELADWVPRGKLTNTPAWHRSPSHGLWVMLGESCFALASLSASLGSSLCCCWLLGLQSLQGSGYDRATPFLAGCGAQLSCPTPSWHLSETHGLGLTRRSHLGRAPGQRILLPPQGRAPFLEGQSIHTRPRPAVWYEHILPSVPCVPAFAHCLASRWLW